MFKFSNTLLIGIAIGILIAPDKGSRTRAKISNKVSDYIDEVGELLSEKVGKIESKLDSVEKLLDTQ